MSVTQIVQAKPRRRPQRLRLADSIPIVLRQQDGHRIPGKLQCVSMTGGLVVPASLLPPSSMVRLIFVTPKGPVTGTAEMLHPVSCAEQPFRFAAIADSDQHRLRAVIEMVYGHTGEPARIEAFCGREAGRLRGREPAAEIPSVVGEGSVSR